MNTASTETLNLISESQAAERRQRLDHLSLMVFEFIAERYIGGMKEEFDGVENPGLIAAARACAFYTEQIGCLDFGDFFVLQIESTDGHFYMIQFSLFGPGFNIRASRVRVTSLPMVGRSGRVDATYNRMHVFDESSKRLKLGKMSTDRAFFVGMSNVIALMERHGEDEGEDARLAPLLSQILPTADELREIRAKLPPSTINYDEEGDLPY